MISKEETLCREDERCIQTDYGYCFYVLAKWEQKPVIFNLYVYPEHRRQGEARRLLKYTIDDIRGTGYFGDIGIEASPREDSISLEQLVSLYKSLGLVVLEKRSE